MPEPIVDLLEAVEVEHEHDSWILGVAMRIEEAGEMLIECAPVEQAGEAVVVGFMRSLQGLLGALIDQQRGHPEQWQHEQAESDGHDEDWRQRQQRAIRAVSRTPVCIEHLLAIGEELRRQKLDIRVVVDFSDQDGVTDELVAQYREITLVQLGEIKRIYSRALKLADQLHREPKRSPKRLRMPARNGNMPNTSSSGNFLSRSCRASKPICRFSSMVSLAKISRPWGT